jgi:catechol 2,3-dioxygenase-like lactoylglutathione lyase family enzyme
MSLIGQLPLAAIKISCKDVEGSKRFYRDIVGLKMLEYVPDRDGGTSSRGNHRRQETATPSKDAHFDLGNIRLTLVPANATSEAPNPKPESPRVSSSGAQLSSSNASGHLVFVVENAIDKVYADLAKRGVKFKSKKIFEDQFGKTVWFSDPDGNVIYLWQPPRRDSKSFKDVEAVVRHYELVSRALADLREGEEEEELEGEPLVPGGRLEHRQEEQIALGK